MSRILHIARREFMAYAKTVGFWLSLLSFPLFAVLGGFLPGLMKNAEPTRQVAIIDESAPGTGLEASVREALNQNHLKDDIQSMVMAAVPEAGLEPSRALRELAEAQGFDAALAQFAKIAPKAAARFEPARRKIILVPVPQPIAEAAPGQARQDLARYYVSKDASKDERLTNVVFLSEIEGAPAARVWAKGTSDSEVESLVREALQTVNRDRIFNQNGIDQSVVKQTDDFRPEVVLYSPRAASGGQVDMKDRLPTVVGLITGFLLWSLVLTGASILLNSVMEEKSGKILEVLLSSASPSEVLAGKVLGVALLTLTVMVAWGGMGGAAMAVALPDVAKDVLSVLLQNGTLIFFLLFMVCGYLMYAVLFTAIGAFCETPRDAQTLMGPIMMALFVPLFVMQMAMRTPDATVVKVMSLIPPFTPFVMPVRLPSGMPMIEIIGGLLGMILFTGLMIWVAQRAFRAGAMSDVKLSWKSFINAVTGRA
jgi:ABC-2 type transport system permease protein